MEKSPSGNGGNGSGLGGLKNLNWPTVILILVTGGGSWFSTVQKGNELSYEQREALQKIRDLHGIVDDIKVGLKNQEAMLRNQKEMLEYLHRAEQNRGNPQYNR